MEGVKKLASEIASYIPGVSGDDGGGALEKLNPMSKQTGGMVPRTGLSMVHEGEAVLTPDDLDGLITEMKRSMSTKRTQVNIIGGLAPFIEEVQSDPDVRR